ncbi:hypothetical protein GJ744_000203 [Endocarpon pusillum]|uniref:Uncharacterized protein n=1 Tax=Endocarpon pusillum TaxID=364733 RepID=A0A8H7AS98_9EURO|nr:hypothetical protein GJ744_000203 [Endocarpon pusillum]
MEPSSTGQAPSTASTSSSVRRNLFTNHLSHRRPDLASSNLPSEPIRNPSANSSTHSLSNLSNAPPPRLPTSRTQSTDSLNNPLATTHHHSRSTTDLSHSNNTNADIVTRDRSGRPDLPEIPLLPPHFRLSSSGHRGGGGGSGGGGGGGDDANNTADEDGMDMDDTEGMELESAMREKEDQERIEKSLVDMMYRSRMRGNGHHGHGGVGGGGGGGGGGGNKGLGQENEELLALVQASLRKKAASLEEDRWMFEGETGEESCHGFR